MLMVSTSQTSRLRFNFTITGTDIIFDDLHICLNTDTLNIPTTSIAYYTFSYLPCDHTLVNE